jgi:hypothetical protein
LIHTTADPYKELVDVLAGFRGRIVDVHVAYPEVLHVEVRDTLGRLWRLATQDATWSPRDPTALSGRAVVESSIDSRTGKLKCELSGGPAFIVTPAQQEADDDPPNWELFFPDGRLLEFGPGARWRIS